MKRKYGIGGILTSLGSIADAAKFEENGVQNEGFSFLSGASNGAALGSTLGPLGALAGTLIGGVSSMAGARKANHSNKLKRRKLADFERDMTENASLAVLNSYPVQGVQTTGYYNNGGKLDPPNTTVARESTAVQVPLIEERTLKQRSLLTPEEGRLLGYSDRQLMYINNGIQRRNDTVANSGYEGRLLVKDPVTGKPTFGNGGNLQLAGGDALPITGKVDYISGDRHSEDTNGDGKSGVQVSLPGQNPFAEIEGGEVMKDGKLIFSDRNGIGDKTYAELAKAIAESPEYKSQERIKMKADRRLKRKLGGIYDKTAKRVINTPDALDRLFEMQESSKEVPGNSEGIAYAADGIDLSTVGDNIAPYLDNIGNTILTSKTPDVPLPRLTNAPRFNTNFNVNDQLAAIETQAQARNRTIKQGVNNSATSRANLIAGTAEDIRATNSVLGEKERIETDLENKQVEATYNNTVRNNLLLQDYDTKNMQRENDIQQRISANLADASTNYMQQSRDKKLDIRDRQALALIAKKYESTGVLSRADVQGILNGSITGEALEELLGKAEQKNKVASSQFRKIPRRKLLDTNTIYDNVYNDPNSRLS